VKGKHFSDGETIKSFVERKIDRYFGQGLKTVLNNGPGAGVHCNELKGNCKLLISTTLKIIFKNEFPNVFLRPFVCVGVHTHTHR
jgi:hypothetical protein